MICLYWVCQMRKNWLFCFIQIVVPPLPGKALKRQLPFRGDEGMYSGICGLDWHCMSYVHVENRFRYKFKCSVCGMLGNVFESVCHVGTTLAEITSIACADRGCRWLCYYTTMPKSRWLCSSTRETPVLFIAGVHTWKSVVLVGGH